MMYCNTTTRRELGKFEVQALCFTSAAVVLGSSGNSSEAVTQGRQQRSVHGRVRSNAARDRLLDRRRRLPGTVHSVTTAFNLELSNDCRNFVLIVNKFLEHIRICQRQSAINRHQRDQRQQTRPPDNHEQQQQELAQALVVAVVRLEEQLSVGGVLVDLMLEYKFFSEAVCNLFLEQGSDGATTLLSSVAAASVGRVHNCLKTSPTELFLAYLATGLQPGSPRQVSSGLCLGRVVRSSPLIVCYMLADSTVLAGLVTFLASSQDDAVLRSSAYAMFMIATATDCLPTFCRKAVGFEVVQNLVRFVSRKLSLCGRRASQKRASFTENKESGGGPHDNSKGPERHTQRADTSLSCGANVHKMNARCGSKLTYKGSSQCKESQSDMDTDEFTQIKVSATVMDSTVSGGLKCGIRKFLMVPRAVNKASRQLSVTIPKILTVATHIDKTPHGTGNLIESMNLEDAIKYGTKLQNSHLNPILSVRDSTTREIEKSATVSAVAEEVAAHGCSGECCGQVAEVLWCLSELCRYEVAAIAATVPCCGLASWAILAVVHLTKNKQLHGYPATAAGPAEVIVLSAAARTAVTCIAMAPLAATEVCELNGACAISSGVGVVTEAVRVLCGAEVESLRLLGLQLAVNILHTRHIHTPDFSGCLLNNAEYQRELQGVLLQALRTTDVQKLRK